MSISSAFTFTCNICGATQAMTINALPDYWSEYRVETVSGYVISKSFHACNQCRYHDSFDETSFYKRIFKYIKGLSA